MSRKTNPTVITPEIKAVIDEWEKFAKENDIQVAPPSVISDIAFKAKANIEYGGACICKRYERPVCPCPQCLDEVKERGLCFCHIFTSKYYK
jgi:ferredoxin-thioredoxin reductase catalytic subunit